MGKMDDENSASSGKKTGNVSRKRQADDPRSSSKKTKPVDMEQLQLQRRMASHVAKIGELVAVVAYGALASQRESFQEKIFNLAMRKLECTDERAKTLIGERISQLRCSMKEIEDNIGGRVMGPRTINFNNVASPSATLVANRVASPATTPTQDELV